jgi:predicted DNA-binding transcriptional regulator YafY
MANNFSSNVLARQSWVRLCINEGLRESFVRQPISDEQVFRLIGGEVFIDFSIQIDENLLHLIQCFGPSVEVIYPPELRELVRRNLSETLYKYRLV